ncbi:MAG: magnesium transporter [Candidatus Magasanikbacteria bacterium]|nr:magnesium transporter [Candidatus Magasanikbacteria bacterium]
MFYLSELIGSKIKDSADVAVGRLEDILIRPKAGIYSPLEFIVIKERKTKQKKILPFFHVENLGRGKITLKALYEHISTLEETQEYLGLYEEILDQQIVDTEGMRIVRVNDLHLGIFQEKMCVLGIDVSFKGILRRLGLSKLDFFDLFKVILIDWRKTQPIHGRLKVDTLAEGLVKLHPADLANIVEKMNFNEGSLLLKTLDKTTAARVLEELQPEIQKILVKRLGPEHAAGMAAKMSVDELADLIQSFSEEEAKELMSRLPVDAKTQKVKKILEYEEDTAGGLMTPEFMAAYDNTAVSEAIEKIKKQFSEFSSIYFVYVVDKEGKFLGAVSLRRLLVAERNQTMREIMKGPRIPVASVEDSLAEVASLMTKYNLLSVAVVDKERKLLGIVTVDDLMRHFVPSA